MFKEPLTYMETEKMFFFSANRNGLSPAMRCHISARLEKPEYILDWVRQALLRRKISLSFPVIYKTEMSILAYQSPGQRASKFTASSGPENIVLGYKIISVSVHLSIKILQTTRGCFFLIFGSL